MKERTTRYARFIAAAFMATAFSWSAVSAAGSVEDLKPAAAPVPSAERAAGDRAVKPGRTAFDEFSVIGDPLYRQGSIEFLRQAVEAGKEGEKAPVVKEKAAVPDPGSVKAGPPPAVKKAAPSRARPSDLRDAPSGVRKSLPAPRIKSPAPKPVPADPVAPRKAS